jgi:hypothetical protein
MEDSPSSIGFIAIITCYVDQGFLMIKLPLIRFVMGGLKNLAVT